MRRLPVAYRPEARDDLADIFRFVLRASQNLQTAGRFVRRIKHRIGTTRDGHATISNPDCAPCRSSVRPSLPKK